MQRTESDVSDRNTAVSAIQGQPEPTPTAETPRLIGNMPLDHLLERHYPGSLRLARSILREESEAADAVQSAYSNALRNLAGFREDSTFATWISRIVVNQCLMRLRQLKRAPSVSIDTLLGEPPQPLFSSSRLPRPDEVLERKEAAVAINRALRHLPETLRRPWLLHEVEGASMRDISQALGISVAAAKSRLFRARVELRRLLTALMGPRQTFA